MQVWKKLQQQSSAFNLSSYAINKQKKKNLSIKDVSGNSGAKTFICMDDEVIFQSA